MSDSTTTASSSGAGSAGAMLRQARQAQGLHIAALAAAIKVTQRKLELLESDQFDQLPDATFTRALAQTVCRALKIDPAPVLALLPAAAGQRLEEVGAGLNAPFRDRPGRMAPKEWPVLGNPVFWLAGLIVLAALVVYFMPNHWLARQARDGLRLGGASAPAATADAASATPAFPAVVSENVATPGDAPNAVQAPDNAAATTGGTPVAVAALQTGAPSAPAVTPGTGPAASIASVNGSGAASAAVPASAAQAAGVAGAIQLRPSAQSWIEVTDARGAVLISRLVEPGEAIGLDGAAPFKLKIGNAGATQVVFRGRTVELAPYIRDNVARFELK